VLLRKYGQEVIRLTAGKRIHGTGAIPGGVNKSVSREERDYLLKDIDQIIEWAESAVGLIKQIFFEQRDYHMAFASIRSNMMSLVRDDGAFEIYHGGLRARTAHGDRIFDHVDYTEYGYYLHEDVKSWSYTKFPFIVSLGPKDGWYRVGPLARVNNCDFFTTPKAEQERRVFRGVSPGGPVQPTLAFHWARMIELLHCAESINDLLLDDDLSGSDLRVRGEMQSTGIGVIEAPRGTLFHHYEIDGDGLVTRANLIVSTTHNNQAMNESIRQVASTYLDGQKLTEPLLNQIEVALRAYDPCLSCATHALGKMPLEVVLHDTEGRVVDRMEKRSSGELCRIAPGKAE